MVSNRVARQFYIASEARLGVARNMTDREIDLLLSDWAEPPADLYGSYVIDRRPDGKIVVYDQERHE